MTGIAVDPAEVTLNRMLGVLLLATTSLVGCDPFELYRPGEPVAPGYAHFPPQVQRGRPFAIHLDLDAACQGTPAGTTAVEDPASRTIAVEVLFRPLAEGTLCPGMVWLQRYEASATASTLGTYTLSFFSRAGRTTRTIEVVEGPVPAWTPPPRLGGPEGHL